jgi:hypothetical protein
MTILDANTDPPSAHIEHAEVVEGNSGITIESFAVVLDSLSSVERTVTVRAGVFAAQGPNATKGTDFDGAIAVLHFPPGVLTRRFDVPVHGDTTVEPDENFMVGIVHYYSDTAYSFNDFATGTIFNDDHPK